MRRVVAREAAIGFGGIFALTAAFIYVPVFVGVQWKVFYVVAPDGPCYWFGERQAQER